MRRAPWCCVVSLLLLGFGAAAAAPVDVRLYHGAPVRCLAFSGDGKLLASASRHNVVWVWDTHTWSLVWSSPLTGGHVTCIAFDPQNRWVAAGTCGGRVTVYDARTGDVIHDEAESTRTINDLVFTPDGRYLLACLSRGPEDPPDLPRPFGGWVTTTWAAGNWRGPELRLILDPSGRAAACLSEGHEGGIGVGPVVGAHLSVLGPCEGPPGSIAAGLGPLGPAAPPPLIMPGWLLWPAGRDVADFGQLAFACFSPDARFLAASGATRCLLWDLGTEGWPGAYLDTHHGKLSCGVFDGDGRRLYLGDWDDTIQVWDVLEGREVENVSAHSADVNCLALSPDGKLLASASDDGTVRIWATGDRLRPLTVEAPADAPGVSGPEEVAPPATPPRRLLMCYDGGLLEYDDATGEFNTLLAPDGLVALVTNRVVHTSDGDPSMDARTMARHQLGAGRNWEGARAAAYSPDGQRIAILCGDGTLAVLDRRGNMVERTNVGASESELDDWTPAPGSAHAEQVKWSPTLGIITWGRALAETLWAGGTMPHLPSSTTNGRHVIGWARLGTLQANPPFHPDGRAFVGLGSFDFTPDGRRLIGIEAVKYEVSDPAPGPLVMRLAEDDYQARPTGLAGLPDLTVVTLDPTGDVVAWASVSGRESANQLAAGVVDLRTLEAQKREVRGDSRWLVWGLRLTWSHDGSRFAVACTVQGGWVRIVVISRSLEELWTVMLPRVAERAPPEVPVGPMSPRDCRLVAMAETGVCLISLFFGADGEIPTRVQGPIWSPDDTKLAFATESGVWLVEPPAQKGDLPEVRQIVPPALRLRNQGLPLIWGQTRAKVVPQLDPVDVLILDW